MADQQAQSTLSIQLANPRGFCAGVDRAIEIVERALEKYGAPVYVRHEIVHNKFVVDNLRDKGAVFVEELDEVPEDAKVIFSAHGVPKSVPAEAGRRELIYFDATCPLVSKVHREAERHFKENRHVVLIGHEGHPEVIGTMGQLPDGAITLIETVDDVTGFAPADPEALGVVTQTTLSVDDTAAVMAALLDKFPAMQQPKKEDICYATTNRQAAVKEVASKCDLYLIIGAPNSSNSRRLVEVALAAGCARAELIQRATDIDWSWFDGVSVMGLSAGASAPEVLVEEVIDACKGRFATSVDLVSIADENVQFKLPRDLVEDA